MINKNGEYYTHPAFTFGDTEVEGIWVGKFEISSSTPTANYGGGNSTSLKVRVKPNVNSWRYNILTNFSYVIQNMQVTDNEYGIYDMSGGLNEYMMGNMSSGSDSYIYYPEQAGSNFEYLEETAKYLDTYAYGISYTDQTAYNRARLGDATGEVKLTSSDTGGWCGDKAGFVRSSRSWFLRGGHYSSGMSAGVFYFSTNNGYPYSGVSVRATLISY